MMIYWVKQKKIKALYELYAKPVREKYGLTQMEHSILMFLHRNPSHDTAASIVSTGQFTKSHVSSAIKALERRQLITGEYRNNNKKTVHLKLTELSDKIVQDSLAAGKQYFDRLFTGFSKDERQQMKHYFIKICENADAGLQDLQEKKDV